MFSPFKTRYHLLNNFPSLVDARFYVLGPHQIGVLLVFREGLIADCEPVAKWFSEFRDFNEYTIVNDTPELIYDKQDIVEESALLGLELDALIDQRTHEEGLVHFLEKNIPCVEVKTLTGFDGWGSISLFLDNQIFDTLDSEGKSRIVRLVHLLLGSAIEVHMRRMIEYPMAPSVRSVLEKIEHEDWQACLDLFSSALEGVNLRSAIPSLEVGPRIYVDSMTASQDLYPLLSLSNTIVASMPFGQQQLEKKFHTPLDEFIRALGTGRIIPVFEERLDVYEKGYLRKLLDAAPRTILPGEFRLRLASAMHSIEPLLPVVERRDEYARKLVQSAEKEATPIAKYIQAIYETSKRYRHCMTMLEPIAKALFPMVEHIDQVVREQLRSQGRVLDEMLLEFATAYRVWLYSHALNSEASIAPEDSLIPFINLYFVNNMDNVVGRDLLIIDERIRWLLGRLGLVSKEISLSEHAAKGNTTQVLHALRILLNSPRLHGDDYKIQLQEIEKELEKMKTSLSIKQWGFFLVSVLSGSLSLAYGADNPILQAVFGTALLKAMPNAPKLLELLKELVSDPEETAMKKLLRFGTPEARLLLKVRGH